MSSFEQLVQYYFFRLLAPGTAQWTGPSRVMKEDHEQALRIARRLFTYVYRLGK